MCVRVLTFAYRGNHDRRGSQFQRKSYTVRGCNNGSICNYFNVPSTVHHLLTLTLCRVITFCKAQYASMSWWRKLDFNFQAQRLRTKHSYLCRQLTLPGLVWFGLVWFGLVWSSQMFDNAVHIVKRCNYYNLTTEAPSDRFEIRLSYVSLSVFLIYCLHLVGVAFEIHFL